MGAAQAAFLQVLCDSLVLGSLSLCVHPHGGSSGSCSWPSSGNILLSCKLAMVLCRLLGVTRLRQGTFLLPPQPDRAEMGFRVSPSPHPGGYQCAFLPCLQCWMRQTMGLSHSSAGMTVGTSGTVILSKHAHCCPRLTCRTACRCFS